MWCGVDSDSFIYFCVRKLVCIYHIFTFVFMFVYTFTHKTQPPHTYQRVNVNLCTIHAHKCMCRYCYGVVTSMYPLKITGLFCKRPLYKRRYSAKETYNFKEPTNRSHPIRVLVTEYSLFYRALLQKRPIILRSLLLVAPHTMCDKWTQQHTTHTHSIRHDSQSDDIHTRNWTHLQKNPAQKWTFSDIDASTHTLHTHTHTLSIRLASQSNTMYTTIDTRNADTQHKMWHKMWNGNFLT